MLKRTKLGILHAVSVQYDGLRLSASAFDAGHRGESVRMANALFVMLGPKMRNHTSIVEQLDRHLDLKIASTADSRGPHGSALIATVATPYVTNGLGDGWIIAAEPFGHEALRGGRTLPINEWWEEGVLGGAGSPKILTRLQVVRVMRDQDGGAHLDDHIRDATYLAVHLRGVGMMYRPAADSEKTLPVEGALEATIRQIAEEALESLRSLFITAQITLRHAAKNGPLATQFFESANEA
jgi:hypothetical protein